MPGSTRFTAIQLGLDIRFGQNHPWRAAINNAADSRAMRLAKSGNGKQSAKRIAGHDDKQNEKNVSFYQRYTIQQQLLCIEPAENLFLWHRNRPSWPLLAAFTIGLTGLSQKWIELDKNTGSPAVKPLQLKKDPR
jgi:hypothetical protein